MRYNELHIYYRQLITDLALSHEDFQTVIQTYAALTTDNHITKVSEVELPAFNFHLP